MLDMKLLIATILCLSANLLFAQQKEQLVEVAFYGGYASADLNWSIAGNSAGQSPNILSEVKWSGISGSIAQMDLKINLTKRWLLIGEFAKCFVKSGTSTDSDYHQDDRQSRTYYAELRSDEGDYNDFSALVGYQFINLAKVKLVAFAGYSESNENLFLLNQSDAASGEKSLRSTYQTSWKGPSVAVATNYSITPKLIAALTFTYSQLNYSAKADWNLIDAFKHPVSFKHDAKGFNVKTLFGVSYHVNEHFAIQLAGNYSNAQTGTGIDQLYLESGSTQVTQFNGAEKVTKSLTAGMVFRFKNK